MSTTFEADCNHYKSKVLSLSREGDLEIVKYCTFDMDEDKLANAVAEAIANAVSNMTIAERREKSYTIYGKVLREVFGDDDCPCTNLGRLITCLINDKSYD